mmetsp:Transcript_13695/g.27930  ORF Transcript_13695/g.27930 Transcript_13695/m.27930 type:complete len:151 (-) Transcript_13695:242-694(-)
MTKFFKPFATISFVCTFLGATAPQSSAIGGWETAQIMLSKTLRENNQVHQRQQTEAKNSKIGESNKSIENARGTSSDSTSYDLDDDHTEKKKRHVSEVTMTANDANQKKKIVSPSSGISPAFVARGRKDSLTLDEKDLERISFVARSPFL